MISSPDSSIAEGDCNNVFTYVSKPFQRAVGNTSSPLPGRKRRRKQRASLDQFDRQLKEQEYLKQQKIEKIHEKMKKNLGSDDGGDSSDEGCQKEVIDIDEDSPRPSKSSSKRDPVELLESSDEEDSAAEIDLEAMESAGHLNAEAFRKSRMAALQLQQAQQYHAEDIHVQIDTRKEPPTKTWEPKEKEREIIPGRALQIKCRAIIYLNGKKQKDKESSFTIRENERLDVLLSKFLDKNDLPETSIVTMRFDDETLSYSRTPRSYGIENKDVIHVQSKSNFVVSIQSEEMQMVGPKVELTLRERDGKQLKERNFVLGGKQNMQDLIDLYRNETGTLKEFAFHFDGEKLDSQKTPTCYDMENGDLIDVVFL